MVHKPRYARKNRSGYKIINGRMRLRVKPKNFHRIHDISHEAHLTKHWSGIENRIMEFHKEYYGLTDKNS